MNLLTQNSKMRQSSKLNAINIYNFGIPAFLSTTGLKTCPNARQCATGCYARSGTYRFPVVQAVYEKRLEATKRDSFALEIGMEIEAIISKSKAPLYIRVHDSGDFYSPTYQRSWYAIARAFPEVKFYAYTKMITQSIKLGMEKPDNFELIFSLGGSEDALISSRVRHSRVFSSETELELSGYVNATHNDLIALGANQSIGLVYHGTKKFTNTKWNQTTLTERNESGTI